MGGGVADCKQNNAASLVGVGWLPCGTLLDVPIGSVCGTLLGVPTPFLPAPPLALDGCEDMVSECHVCTYIAAVVVAAAKACV